MNSSTTSRSILDGRAVHTSLSSSEDTMWEDMAAQPIVNEGSLNHGCWGRTLGFGSQICVMLPYSVWIYNYIDSNRRCHRSKHFMLLVIVSDCRYDSEGALSHCAASWTDRVRDGRRSVYLVGKRVLSVRYSMLHITRNRILFCEESVANMVLIGRHVIEKPFVFFYEEGKVIIIFVYDWSVANEKALLSTYCDETHACYSTTNFSNTISL